MLPRKWEYAPIVTNFNLLNSSLNSYNIIDNKSHVRFSNFLNLLVLGKQNMTGLENISIKIYDSAKVLSFDGKTGPDGRTSYIPLLWKEAIKSKVSTFTPHKLVLSRGSVTKIVENVDMSIFRNLTVLFDDLPPALNITYPLDGLIVNMSLINITGTTDSDSIVTLNNETINNFNGTISQAWWLDEGLNTLRFKARDPDGNTVEILRNVTVKTFGPSIRITEPTDGCITNQPSIIVRGITNGSRVEIEGNPTHLNPDGTFISNYSFPAEGKYTINVISWDTANNSANAHVKVEYDKTPPLIEIFSPVDDVYTNLDTIEIKGRVLGASTAILNDNTIDLNLNKTFSFILVLIDGMNNITIRARDAAGNENATNIVVNLDTSILLEIT